MIVRTAAQGATREDFEREIKYLHKLHDVLQQRAKETTAPAMVFQEADLSVRVARDIFSGEFEKAIVDDEKQHHRLESFFNRTAPELLERLESLRRQDEPLFEKYGVEEAIQSVLKRRVDLPSGGYLMIDYAEAMTVIDVNSGSFTGRGKGAKLEDTITRTNLEAAEEVVSQLRLRDIGGIIVIDFIDMARARNRDTVLKTLRKSLDEDRTKTYVVEISPLGLVEMTRQNVTDGVREIMTKPCPVCEGEGVVLSEDTVAIEVDRWLRDLAAERPKAPAFLIRVHPKVASILVGGHGVEGPIHEIEQETGRHFHFEGTEALPIDHFEVVLEGTPDEIEERALPFREGEEVLVHIEEPHMYNEDDAVAKLDGYVVSVFGAATAGGREDARPDREGGPQRGRGLAGQPARGQRGRGIGLRLHLGGRPERPPPPPRPPRRPRAAEEGGKSGSSEALSSAESRLASLNVESLFDRPKAMNPLDWSFGREALAQHARINELFEEPVYTDVVKDEIKDLLTKLGLAKADDGGKFARLRQNRGKLLQRNPLRIVADGRDSWVRVGRARARARERQGHAAHGRSVIRDVDAHVLGGRRGRQPDRSSATSSKVQLSQVGATAYEHVMLIDGNAQPRHRRRHPDPQGLRPRRHPLARRRRPGASSRIFSRDCPEYTIRTPAGERIVVLVTT